MVFPCAFVIAISKPYANGNFWYREYRIPLSVNTMARPARDWENRIGRRLKLRDLHILSVVARWEAWRGGIAFGHDPICCVEAIANLESALGVRLLDRSSRGIEPTIYATALLKRGHVVFDELRGN